MTELTLVIIALLITMAWLVRENHSQQKKLIKAILSKNVQEFTNSELAENFKPKKEKKEDLVPVNDLTDKEFFDAIKKGKKKLPWQ